MDSERASNMSPISDWADFLQKSKTAFLDNYQKKSPSGVAREDYDFMHTLGTGAFGRVMLAKTKTSGKYLAIKVLEKGRILKTKQVSHVINEKRILQGLFFPFTIYLEQSFQDHSFLYLCLPFVNGGEMFTYCRKVGKIDETSSKFYASQVLLALEYIHNLDLIYRDLKPENILIDSFGYIKITDFGFCKMVKGRTYTLCGTPEYLAPEIVLSKGYGKAVDWWSMGVLIYELVAGYPPFYANDPMKIYEKIVAGRYRIPSHFSADLRDLLKNILQTDLSKRFGNLRGGVGDIKDHKWFRSIEWLSVLNKTIDAPYIPKVKDAGDATNFDRYEEVSLDVAPVNKYGNEFDGF